MRDVIVRDLIFDVGMSEGDDTDFYLKKGFRVIGVEADPKICEVLERRFETERQNGRLTVINHAAFSESGKTIDFFVDQVAQGHSKVFDGRNPSDRKGQIVSIDTISWDEIVAVAGVPYYCKIDIEGAESAFLTSLQGRERPEFISVECHGFGPIESLYNVGYRKFKIIHQNNHNGFVPQNPAKEGIHLPGYRFKHSSGYFGEELYGPRWLTFHEAAVAFDAISRLRTFGSLPHIWFDCHARY